MRVASGVNGARHQWSGDRRFQIGMSWRAIIGTSVACFTAATGPSTAGVAADSHRAAPLKLFGAVGPGLKISLRDESGAKVGAIDAGAVTLQVTDRSRTDNFHLAGVGVNKATGLRFRGTVTWKLTLQAGRYMYWSDRHKRLHGSFTVQPIVPEQLLGIWNRNITDPTVIGASHVGVWSLSFDQNGVLTVYEPVGAHVPGVRDSFAVTFSATADGQLVVGAGPGCGTKSIYHWQLADAFLRIQKVSVDCPLPAAVLPGDWSR